MGVKVNMDGVWFVHYYIPQAPLYGNTIVTIDGAFENSDIVPLINKFIYSKLSDAERALVPSPNHIVIGNLTKIGNIS